MAAPYSTGPIGPPSVPIPPTYDVTAVGQPFSAPPTSGPYGYGIPMMSAIPAPEPRRSRVGTVILSVLTTLFLVAAGVLGTLFVLKNQEAKRLDSQVSQLGTDLAASKTKAESAQKDLDSTKRDLSDAKAQVDEITTQKKALADCINAIVDAGRAAASGANSATLKVKEADLEKKCDAAQKYL
jgi:septal ring factor EnvC (AmiA/AmiB activator)